VCLNTYWMHPLILDPPIATSSLTYYFEKSLLFCGVIYFCFNRCTTIEASPTSITCSCSHLTEFTAGFTAPHCGDGLVNVASERCDDGKYTSGDGCSTSCMVHDKISHALLHQHRFHALLYQHRFPCIFTYCSVLFMLVCYQQV
jgi:cysteine-rich repeat protein